MTFGERFPKVSVSCFTIIKCHVSRFKLLHFSLGLIFFLHALNKCMQLHEFYADSGDCVV